MNRDEKFALGLTAICMFATAVVGVGLKLLGASSEVISLGFLLVLVFGGLGGGYAYDRYTHPPEKH